VAVPLHGLVARRLAGVVEARMVDEPVILVQGPRAVGKSTLLRELAAAARAEVIDLDDLAVRDAVGRDPGLFVSGDGPVFIDEYQRAPVVLEAIKAELNRDSRPGRFVLTGSARHESLPTVAQALTGRLHRLPVYPLSQGEIGRVHERLLDGLFADATAVVRGGASSRTTRADYIARVVAGGFPLALARGSAAARNRWFDDYVRLSLERDVQELSKIRQAAALPRFLERLAGQTAQVLNVNRAATSVQLDDGTARSYLRLLDAVFLLYLLPAWGTSLSARSTKSPKLHLLDSGVAARLLRLGEDKLAARSAAALTEFGHLLETFVVTELLKQASWADWVAGVGHWRTTPGDEEVDLVVEREDGMIVAFEVKASGRIPGPDLNPLRKLRDALGEQFLAGVAFYLGTRSYTYEDRIHVLPVDSIWTP